MTVEQITGLINQVGFPIAVASYLLFRGDKLMREMTKSVKELTEVMRQCTAPKQQ